MAARCAPASRPSCRAGATTITTPAFAGSFVLNGAGEMTGRSWIEESGLLEGPVMLTNTHSVGTVHEATIAWRVKNGDPDASGYWWSTPVVAETWDGELNDVNGFHVKAAHVDAAIEGAKGGPVDEGNVGGGTGMTCHGFKCGIGTASRHVDVKGHAAHGRRAGAGELRHALVAAHRRRAGRPAPARCGQRRTRRSPTATTAPSSSSWRRTRRSCRTSSIASRSAPAWDSRGSAPSRATVPATSSSPSRRRTRSPWKAR